MNSKTKVLLSLLGLIALIALAVLMYGWLNKKNTANENPAGNALTAQQQKLAADFSVMDSSGNMVKLSDFLGKPIVLNFWASWCPPCKSEMPEFDKVYGELKDSVVFLMVDLTDGQRETVESAKAYAEGQGYAFPIYFDTKGEVSSLYNIDTIPQTFFIDKLGFLTKSTKGTLSEKALRQFIKEIHQ